MLKRVPIYPDIGALVCSNRNIHEYTPYIISDIGENIIDDNWWNSLTQYCQDLIKARTNNNFKLQKVNIPHKFQFDNESKFLSIIYKSYIDSFDYQCWYDESIPLGPKNVSMVFISPTVKSILVKWY